MSLIVAVVMALGLDYGLGEPKRLHPLVGFGSLADGLEKWLNGPGVLGLLAHQHKASQISAEDAPRSNAVFKCKGTIALILAIGPLSFAAYSLQQTLATSAILSTLFAGFVLYLAIGWRRFAKQRTRTWTLSLSTVCSAGSANNAYVFANCAVSTMNAAIR